MAMSGTLLGFMKEELKACSPRKFQPCAYYDKHLDCIRLKLKEGSYYERRLNKFFTVLLANHTETDEYVGLTIKGVQHLFRNLGLSAKSPLMIAEILDRIIKKYPDGAAKTIEEAFGETL